MKEYFPDINKTSEAGLNLERAFQGIPVGLCVLDRELRYEYINEWLAALNGQSVAYHIGQYFGDVRPHIADQVIPLLEQVIKSGEPLIDGEVTVETPVQPGVLRTFKYSYLPNKSDDNIVIGVSCVVEEISALKSAEEKFITANKDLEDQIEERTHELRESEFHHKLAIKQAKIGFWRWSLEEEKLTYWSENYKEIGSYQDNAPGNYLEMVKPLHPEDRDRVLQAYIESDKGPSGYNVEYRIVEAGNKVRYIHEHADVEYNEQGEAISHVGFIHDITERRQTEEELIKSQSRLLEAQKIAHLGHWERDYVNDTLWWSDEIYEIFGLGSEKYNLTINSFNSLIHPDDLDRVTDEILSALENHSLLNLYHRIVLPNGEVRILHEQGATTYNDAGEPIRMDGTVLDITELKRAEEAALQSQARLTEILEIAPEAVITVNADMNIQIFNQSAERIFKFTRDEVIGKSLDVLMPERFRGGHKNMVKGFINSDDTYRLMGKRQDILGLRKDGTEFPASASVSKLGIAGEELFTVMLMDVTERNNAEKALVKHSSFMNLMQSIAVAANEALSPEDAFKVSLKEICNFTDWPIGYVYLLNVDRDKLMVSNIWHLSDQKKFKSFQQKINNMEITQGFGLSGKSWKSGQPEWIEDFDNEVSFSTELRETYRGAKSGFSFPVLIGKQTVAILEFCSEETSETDIELMEVLRQVSTQLGRVYERAQLANSLQIVAEEARSANLSKSEFLAAMSHDLRTPLNAIIGFSDIICRQHFGSDSKKYQEYAQDIFASGELLLSMVNDILDLAAIESGKQVLVKENVHILEVVLDCEKIIKEKAQALGIDVVVNVPDNLPEFYGDRRGLVQILLNLIANSIKFTPEGGKINISVFVTRDSHVFEVNDTGMGIPVDKINTITDAFVIGENNPYKTKDSTGLGLAIVKSLVELHGGKLEIKSKIGVGTTVSAIIPFSEKE
jgi:PAS domain S-box-containing protein